MESSRDQEITIKDIFIKAIFWWKYLLIRKLLILVVALSGGILGLIYGWVQKYTYTATTTFVLEEKGGGGSMLGQYAGIASMVGVDIGGGGGGLFEGENIIELYKSRNMVEKALLSKVTIEGKETVLIDYYIEFNKLREAWKDKYQLRNIKFNSDSKNLNRTQDSILGIIYKEISQKNLVVSKPDKKLSIIKVEVRSKDEIFSKVFNDQIVNTVNDFYVSTKTKRSLENVSILQHQTDSVRNVLNGAIYQTVAVSDAIPNLNPSKQVLRVPAEKSHFTAEVNKVILSELVKNLELAKLSLRGETPLIQVVDHPIYPLQKERFGRVKGFIVGTFIFGFLIVFYLSIKLIFKNILSGE